jgi:predicted RNA binding protein YcfA (HicA-like mRNA interferase family)
LAYREVRRRLQAAGFVEISQRGSHVKFIRTTPEATHVVIVPRHSVDVPVGTLRSILNQADLTPEDFEKL